MPTATMIRRYVDGDSLAWRRYIQMQSATARHRRGAIPASLAMPSRRQLDVAE